MEPWKSVVANKREMRLRCAPLITPCQMCASYEAGMTIKQLSKMSGVCVGTVFNILKNTNCKMRKRGHPVGFIQPKEWAVRSGISRRGMEKSAETRKRISEGKKRHYNGMNGYGHTKKNTTGYIKAYAPDHPRAYSDGYMLEHVMIMERVIGRYLNPNEVVHHINGDKTDNRVENLMLMDRSEHISMHQKERYAKKREAKGGMTY